MLPTYTTNNNVFSNTNSNNSLGENLNTIAGKAAKSVGNSLKSFITSPTPTNASLNPTGLKQATDFFGNPQISMNSSPLTTSTGVADHTKKSILSSTSSIPPAQNYVATGVNAGINPYDIKSVAPAISTNINDTPAAHEVQNVTGLSVPDANNNSSTQGSLSATASSYMTPPTGYTTDAQGNLVQNPTDTPDVTNRGDILKRVLSDTTALGGKGQATLDQYSQNGVDDKQQSYINAYNQYKQKEVQYRNMENNYLNANHGQDSAWANQDFLRMQRNNNADLANLATIAQAAQGNYQGALDIVKRKIDAEFDPIQNEVDNLSKFIQTNNDNLTASDKIQLENQRFQLQTNLDLLKTAKTSAHQFALQQGITDPQILNAIDSATSPSSAYQAVGMTSDGQAPQQGAGEQSLSQTSRQYVDHSTDGVPYVDQTRLDNMTPYQKQVASAEYARAGIRVLDPADVSALGTIDGAKQDLALFADTANNLLSSGFFGRIAGYTTNQLAQLTQSNPQWRQFQTLRTGLIKAVQGVASGAPGLRVTGAELSNAAESLPNSFDNKESAQQAIQTFSQLLNVNRNVLLRGNAPQDSSNTPSSGGSLYSF